MAHSRGSKEADPEESAKVLFAAFDRDGSGTISPEEFATVIRTVAGPDAFTAQDIRFTTNKGALYALFLGRPGGSTTIRSLARGRIEGQISQVTLLGGGPLAFRQDGAGLHVDMPQNNGFVPAVRIDGRGLV